MKPCKALARLSRGGHRSDGRGWKNSWRGSYGIVLALGSVGFKRPPLASPCQGDLKDCLFGGRRGRL